MSSVQLYFSHARVFDIPELLRVIFEFSTPKDAASHCCICQTWFPEAAGVAWRRVNVERLLTLLAPVTMDDNGFTRFSRRLQPEDWARFDKYASMIYDLDVYAMTGYDTLDFSPALAEIRSSLPRVPILPNLRRLYMANHRAVDIFAGFGGPNVTVLTLGVYINDVDTVTTLLASIPSTMPNLVELTVPLTVLHIDFIESSVEKMFRSLPSLRKLILPPGWLTPRITQTLASQCSLLEELDSVSLRTITSKGEGVFLPFVDAESFRFLQSLSLTIELARAIHCFSQGRSFPSVTSLSLYSSGPASSACYLDLAKAIPPVFPNIKTLTIDCFDNAYEALGRDTS